MKNYTYQADFEHGSAAGEVQAKDVKEAKAKVKAMYHGNAYDTFDSKSKPIVKTVNVTNVTVTLVKE